MKLIPCCGGNSYGGGVAMPTIFFYGPALEREKRTALIRGFTRIASEATGIGESAFVVYLQETDPAHVGVGGELLEDRQKK